MKSVFIRCALTLILFFSQNGIAKGKEEINYFVSVYRKTAVGEPFNSLFIEKLVVMASPGMGEAQVQKINRELEKLYVAIYSDARSCYVPEIKHPWGFSMKHEQIHLAYGILGIVFDISAVCAGEPHFGKVVQNFSIRTGKAISSFQLVRRYMPSLIKAGAVPDESFLILGEEAAEILVDQNEHLLTPELKKDCDYYFKTTAFDTMVKQEGLVLLPVYQRAFSKCQKEYLLRIE